MLRKAFCSVAALSFLMILSLPHSNSHALSIGVSPDNEPASGEPESLCEQYPPESQKKFICSQYHESKVKEMDSLPTNSSTLKENTLYIVSKSAHTLNAPYVIPKNAAVIPHPDTTILDISLTGTGAGTECGICGISRSEGSMVAGFAINNSGHWNPKASSGDRKSIVYAATTESLFAESVLWGATGFDDLIYEKVIVETDRHPTLASLRLFLNGANNGLTVVNRSDQAVLSAASDDDMVHIDDLVVTLGGSIAEKTDVQAGVNLINVNPAIKNAQVLFEPIAATETFQRIGIAAEDTPLMIIAEITFAVTKSGFRRAMDVQEYYSHNSLSHLTVFSGPNRYIKELVGQPVIEPYESDTDDDTTLKYILLGESTAAPDVNIKTDVSFIDTFTRGGGSYLASALQLNETCNTLSGGNYSPRHPFPLTSQFSTMMGPSNATVLTYTQACAFRNNNDCSTYEKWKWGSIGFATGIGGLFTLESFMLACFYCVKRTAGRLTSEHQPLLNQPNQ